jgi:hypothetical protein
MNSSSSLKQIVGNVDISPEVVENDSPLLHALSRGLAHLHRKPEFFADQELVSGFHPFPKMVIRQDLNPNGLFVLGKRYRPPALVCHAVPYVHDQDSQIRLVQSLP